MFKLQRQNIIGMVVLLMSMNMGCCFADNQYCPATVHCSDSTLASCACMVNGVASSDWILVPDDGSFIKAKSFEVGEFIFHNAMIQMTVSSDHTVTNCAYVDSQDINSENRASCVAKASTIMPDLTMPGTAWKFDEIEKLYYCGTYNFPTAWSGCPLRM